ncbi:amino acid ABC transporter permease [Rhodobacteraceae bacterium RKSG542]|uniref:amino acid ABC transporter permease n=1 Tax=Pseudovibrio flavus TaxID=2529854 RepID=UPI0012BD7B59|nr:amino acid ABC transporter permease [Pseudovibrio flavus]MTI16440.1 amino acid ABC transporter permease [Pseudovibrio flavus]
MDIELMQRVAPFFLEAAWVTLELAVLSTLLGLTLGAIAASAKLYGNVVFRSIATVYVSVIRGTPCLIQLFILYFGGPQIGINLDPFSAGVIGLGINIGAYMTETIRGAIIAVDSGQMEAARTLGLSKFQAVRKVILPQAARLMVRPLGVNINAQIKATALVSAISVVDLTYTAQRYIGSTYKPFEMFILAGVLYMVIITLTGMIVSWLNKRVAIQ